MRDAYFVQGDLMFFNDWLDILLYRKKPEQLVAEKPELGKAFLVYFCVSMITSALVAISNYLQMQQMVAEMQGMAAIYGAGSVSIMPVWADPSSLIITVIIYAVLSFFLGLAFAFIGNSLIFVFARLVGGKGDFSSTLAVLFLVQAAFSGMIGIPLYLSLILALMVPTIALILIPVILVALPLGLYALAWDVLVVKHVQGISTGRAIVAVIVIPLAILIVVSIIIGILIWSWIMSFQSTMPQAAGMFSLLQ
jgi:hypothetical protein